MSASPVEAVFFDIDDTLVDGTAATRAGALGMFDRYRDRWSESDECLMQRWDALLEHHFDRYLRGETSFVGQGRARIRGLFGLTAGQMPDPEADEVFAVYSALKERAWTLFPDVVDALEALSCRRLGVISNGSSARQRQKLASLGVLDRFAVVVISEDLGAAKPHPRIFQAACQGVGASPSACLHVGDRLDVDALGARDAGLRGVWLDRAGKGDGPSSVTTIARLTELLALVLQR